MRFLVPAIHVGLRIVAPMVCSPHPLYIMMHFEDPFSPKQYSLSTTVFQSLQSESTFDPMDPREEMQANSNNKCQRHIAIDEKKKNKHQVKNNKSNNKNSKK